MGKSSKKPTKVDTAAAVTLPLKSAGKGKRGSEEVIEKLSAKKLKKNDDKAQAIEKLKNETKTQKKNIKKKESSSSDDESSESEEEEKVPPVKAVKPSTKKPAVAATNGTVKKDKTLSSSDSSDDSESEKDTKLKSKVIAPSAKKVESSSDSDSDSSSDSEDDAPKPVQGKKVAPTADTRSDSSSEEENDKKTTAVNKSSAAAKKKDDSSSDDEDDSSEDSSESDDKATVSAKNDDSSDSSSESDSEDDTTPAKKPASANGTNSNQSTQVAKKGSSTEESSEDEDSSEEEDVEMVDAVSPKTVKKQAGETVKKAPQTPGTPQTQSGGSKTLFVGNLPYSVEQADVENFFKEAGEVTEVRFASDREGNFKGFGHVEFATEEAAQKALGLNGKELMGRPLKLDLANERGAYTPGTERTPFQKRESTQGSTLFVGGIDRSSGEDEVRSVLEKHFASCGEFTRVSIPPNRETGELKGIAYIDFTDRESLNKAIELGGPEFGGYTLNVDEAKPRDNSGPGGRGSGRFQRGGRSGGGRFDRSGGDRNGGGSGGRSGGRSGGGRSGGRRGGFNNRPSMAAPGTGKKTTFND